MNYKTKPKFNKRQHQLMHFFRWKNNVNQTDFAQLIESTQPTVSRNETMSKDLDFSEIANMVKSKLISFKDHQILALQWDMKPKCHLMYGIDRVVYLLNNIRKIKVEIKLRGPVIIVMTEKEWIN